MVGRRVGDINWLIEWLEVARNIANQQASMLRQEDPGMTLKDEQEISKEKEKRERMGKGRQEGVTR